MFINNVVHDIQMNVTCLHKSSKRNRTRSVIKFIHGSDLFTSRRRRVIYVNCNRFCITCAQVSRVKQELLNSALPSTIRYEI